MNGDNRPERKWTGLAKLFRDALEEEMGRDPTKHIKDSYDKKLENECGSECADDSYVDDSEHNAERLEEEQWDKPLRHVRDTYNRILDSKYTESKAEPSSQQKGSDNNTRVDPFQRIREAYDHMFDDRERKYWEEQEQKNKQRPWWKKIF